MRGWSLETIGTIRYREDLPMPEPAGGEVLVRVDACGICGSDIPRVYKTGAHQMPLIIGHEFTGRVTGLGEYTKPEWLGKKVGIFPLIPCKTCPACRQGRYEMCEHYNYLGSRCNGGFAEYVAVPEWNLIALPESISAEQAAMLEPMAVAVHAIRRLKIDREMSVAVCGLGTIGQFVIMFLMEMGIREIYAIGSKEIHKRAVLQFGLAEDHYCDNGRQDVGAFLREKTQGHGVDAYFECVGKNETAAQGIESLAAGGQICLVGNPYSDMELSKELYWRILRKQLRLTGTWNSSYAGPKESRAKKEDGSACSAETAGNQVRQAENAGRTVRQAENAGKTVRQAEDIISPAGQTEDDWHYVIDRLAGGRIHPEGLITRRLPLEDLNKGLLIMRDKSEEYIKIMVTMD